MKRLALFLIPFLFIFTACSEDDSRNGTPDPAGPNYANPHLSGTSVSADYAGRITNNSGAAVANALVQVGGKSAQTNELGFYNITNASTDQDYAVLSVTANGFFKQFRSLKPRTDHKNYVDIALITQTFNGFFEASTGGTVSIPGGASAIFPAGALTDEQGNAYTGQVVLSTTYLNPTDPRLPTYMPGSLQAVDSEGESVAMITYGMIGVELLSGSGEPLKLAQGKKAILEFPVQTEQTAHAPQTIPLWFFDEISGIWREEGSATRIGDKYVGDVSHFSFWNCDIPVPQTILSGTIIYGEPGGSLADIYLLLTRPDGSTAYGNVQSDGYFSGIVPANEVLILSVHSYVCGSSIELYSTTIGPLEEGEVDLGNIEVTPTSNLAMVISGIVTDCDSNPIEGIAVQITVSENAYPAYVVTNELGEFSRTYFCLSSGASTIDLVDLANLQFLAVPGPNYNVNSSTDYPIGNLSFCESEELENYITYTEGSNSFTFIQVADSALEDCQNLTGSICNAFTTSYINITHEQVLSTGPVATCSSITSNVHFSENPGTSYYATFSNTQINVTQLQLSGLNYLLLKGTYTTDVTVTSVGSGSQESYTSTASGTFRFQP